MKAKKRDAEPPSTEHLCAGALNYAWRSILVETEFFNTILDPGVYLAAFFLQMSFDIYDRTLNGRFGTNVKRAQIVQRNNSYFIKLSSYA